MHGLLCPQIELKGIKAKAQNFEEGIELWRGRFTGAPEYNSVIAARLAVWEESERQENEKALKIMRSVSSLHTVPGSFHAGMCVRAAHRFIHARKPQPHPTKQ